MLEQAVIYEPHLGYPFYLTAKRYWLPEFEAVAHSADALTLIFLHSTSFHKETWEPTIKSLFQLALRQKGSIKIQEAWAIEAPNHGVSAGLNDAILRLPKFSQNFTCEKYAQAAHHFLSADARHGAQIDFKTRNLVGIGHSLGGVSMMFLQHIRPIIPFSSVILVEPMVSSAGPEHLHDLSLELVRGAYERRDCWPSRQSAKEALTTRNRTLKWRPEILDLYVKYAIRDHPGLNNRDAAYNGVTLALSSDEEAAMYRDTEALTKPLPGLKLTCTKIPVHVVFGATNDLIPRAVQDALTDSTTGRQFASITRVDSGHLIPQEAPDKLAEVIFRALSSNGRLVSGDLPQNKL